MMLTLQRLPARLGWKLFAMLVVCLLASLCVPLQARSDPSDDISPRDQILDALAEQDRRLDAGLTLDVRMRLVSGPSEAPRQGEERVGKMTRVGTATALATQSRYSKPPRYVAPDRGESSTHHDDQGRYLVWRVLREDALLSGDTFTRRTEILLHRVDADGHVETADEPFVLTLVFDAKDTWAHWQLGALLQALGRGYGSALASSDLTSQSTRQATLRGPGLFANRSGTWTAEIRSDLDHLVQSATFSIPDARPGTHASVLHLETQIDARTAATGFGSRGTIRLGMPNQTPYVFEMTLDAVTHRADAALLRHIRQRLKAPRSATAKTYDYRLAAVGGNFGFIDQAPAPEQGPKPPCCLCQEVDPKIIECYNHPGATCYSWACQEKIVDSARCTPFQDSIAQDCARSPSNGPLYTILEKSMLDTEGDCPDDLAPSDTVTDWVSFEASCYQCRPDRFDAYEVACPRRSCAGPLVYTRYAGLGWDCPRRF